ncbi:deoxyribodipyrimidine photo-lyase [Rhodoferax aquaticus]|nr:deoxyribodipyrimidine photo-lyase [Rhodoferax aquaticus]
MASTRALVWFKRDLRVHDHAPLVATDAPSPQGDLFA